MRFLLLRLAVAFLGCLPTIVLAGSDRPPALKLEDVLSMRVFAYYAPIAPAPDGRMVAYVVRRPTAEAPETAMLLPTGAPRIYRSTSLFVSDARSGEAIEVSGGKGANWGAAWSPDGTRLAFLSDRDGSVGLWLWERSTHATRRIGRAFPRMPAGMTPRWTRDGHKLLLGLAPLGETYPEMPVLPGDAASAADELTVQTFSSRPGVGSGSGIQTIGSNMAPSDLGLIDVATGSADRLVRGVRLLRWEFAPDERHIAYSELSGENMPGRHIYRYSLNLFDFEAGSTRQLVAPDEISSSGRDFIWSPDGTRIAYRIGDPEGDIHVATLDGRTERAIGTAHPPFYGMPAWTPDGDLLAMSEDSVWRISAKNRDAHVLARLEGHRVRAMVPALASDGPVWLRDGGRSILVVAQRGTRNRIHRVCLAGGAQLVREEPMEYAGGPGFNFAAAPSANRLFYAAEDAQRPEDLWVAEGRFASPKRLTDLNPGISAVPMGQMRVIAWTGADGRTYSGPLVLPSDYQPGKRYPLAVHVYPYEPAVDANKFGSTEASNEFVNLQLLATRGYAVLFSGATLRPDDREPMRSVANAVLPGVDKVIAMGVADPERVGVFGQSAGAYSTLALIVQSNRFKAAVAQSGPGNLLSLYGDLRESGYSHGLALDENTFRMPDHPWKARDQYIRNSPWFFLDRVETPLLLIHGMEDSAAIVTQANEIFVGLRRLGKRVDYARYAGEGHIFASYANRLDAGRRFLDWFERYLQPAQFKPDGPDSPAVTGRPTLDCRRSVRQARSAEDDAGIETDHQQAGTALDGFGRTDELLVNHADQRSCGRQGRLAHRCQGDGHAAPALEQIAAADIFQARDRLMEKQGVHHPGTPAFVVNEAPDRRSRKNGICSES